MNYEYKCVAAPPVSPLYGDSTGEIVRQYEHVINDVASGGWEFVGIETVLQPDDMSWFAQLKARNFGFRRRTDAMKIMVFRKEDRFSSL